jgi:predicted nucleotidyltransferase
MPAMKGKSTRPSQAFDFSGWDRRDEARARGVRDLLDRLAASRGALERLLQEEGVTEAWIFGSVARGTPRVDSDVDMAVAGCRPDRLYRLAARIERELSLPLDLVDLHRAPADLAQAVRTDGIRLIPQASSHDQA